MRRAIALVLLIVSALPAGALTSSGTVSLKNGRLAAPFDLCAQPGVFCDGVTDDLTAASAIVAAQAGGLIVVAPGKNLKLGGPGNGNSALVLPAYTRLEGLGDATVTVATQACDVGALAGAGCQTNDDCNYCTGCGAALCVGTAFAPSSGDVVGVIDASATGAEVVGLRIDARGYTNARKCASGSHSGDPCDSYCSVLFLGVAKLNCSTDADCSGLSLGTCTNKDHCGDGVLCTSEPDAPAGPGKINPVIVGANGRLERVTVLDLHRGDWAAKVGGGAIVRDVELSGTRFPTTFLPQSFRTVGTGIELAGADVSRVRFTGSTSAVGLLNTGGAAAMYGINIAGPVATGISVTGGRVHVSDATVAATTGASITTATQGTVIDTSFFTNVTTGVAVSGAGNAWLDKLNIAGTTTGVLVSAGGHVRVTDNQIALSGTNARGVDLRIGSNLIEGNTITAAAVGSRGVYIEGTQDRVADNLIAAFNCLWVDALGQNVTFDSDRCFGGEGAKIVAQSAGVQVLNGYYAWGTGGSGQGYCVDGTLAQQGLDCTTATAAAVCTGGGTCRQWAGIMAGLAPGFLKATAVNHMQMRGALVYTPGADSLRFEDPGLRCAGSNTIEPYTRCATFADCQCTGGTVALDCPGSGSGCSAGACTGGATACVATQHVSSQASGNLFLSGVTALDWSLMNVSTGSKLAFLGGNQVISYTSGVKPPATGKCTDCNVTGNDFSGVTNMVHGGAAWDSSVGDWKWNVPLLPGEAGRAFLPTSGGGAAANFWCALQGTTCNTTMATACTSATNTPPVAASGVVTDVTVRLTTAPGASQSWTVTVLKNGSALTGSPTCSVAGTNTTCTGTGGTGTVAAGDQLCVAFTEVGTAANAGNVVGSIMYGTDN